MASDAGERSCPICRDGQPLDLIAELPAVWVTAQALASLPGYVCVIAKRHVVEPIQLPSAEMTAFWSESMSVARALHELLDPLKMNYEIHGNSIQHLHLHLYPRFRGDPYEGRPIDGRSTDFERSPEDLARIRGAIEPGRPARGRPEAALRSQSSSPADQTPIARASLDTPGRGSRESPNPVRCIGEPLANSRGAA